MTMVKPSKPFGSDKWTSPIKRKKERRAKTEAYRRANFTGGGPCYLPPDAEVEHRIDWIALILNKRMERAAWAVLGFAIGFPIGAAVAVYLRL